MTSNKNRKAEIRRVGEALGIKYTAAARAVELQEAGLMPKLPPSAEIVPGNYDPLHDTLRDFIGATPSGDHVMVPTSTLVTLISEMNWNVSEFEPDLPDAFDQLTAGFEWDAELNQVDREVGERLLDLCAALAGERLDSWEDHVFQGRVASSLLKALVEAGGALIAALGARPAGDTGAAVAVLWDRFVQLRTRHATN